MVTTNNDGEKRAARIVVQARTGPAGVKVHRSIRDALQHAMDDTNVWALCFEHPTSRKHCRLLRTERSIGDDADDADDAWVQHPVSATLRNVYDDTRQVWTRAELLALEAHP
jgi:acid stress-induced BolA-like protein IbaG/YrbA